MISMDIEKVWDKLEQHEKRITAIERMLISKPEAIKQKGFSIKEFILTKKPKDDVQKTLVIGYYLEKYNRMSSFNVKDLEYGFRQAREPVPKNINYKIFLNAKKGHMMEAKEQKDKLKAFNITGSGERFVENELKND